MFQQNQSEDAREYGQRAARKCPAKKILSSRQDRVHSSMCFQARIKSLVASFKSCLRPSITEPLAVEPVAYDVTLRYSLRLQLRRRPPALYDLSPETVQVGDIGTQLRLPHPSFVASQASFDTDGSVGRRLGKGFPLEL